MAEYSRLVQALSTPQAVQIRELIDRVLAKHAEHSSVELAASLGVVDSYVSKLRSGWRPTRVRPELHARLKALAGDVGAARSVREDAGAWGGAGSREYYRGKQDTLMDMMRWVVDQQAEIGGYLKRERAPAPSPTADEVEAGAAILESLPPLQPQKPAKHRKRA